MKIVQATVEKIATALKEGTDLAIIRATGAANGKSPEWIDAHIAAAQQLLTAAPATTPAAVAADLPTFEPDYVPVEVSEASAAALSSDKESIFAVIEKQLPAVLAYVRARLQESNLKPHNDYLAANHKRLITLDSVALFLTIHRLSVRKQMGQSPRDRFLYLSNGSDQQTTDLFGGKWDKKHFTVLMRILTDELKVTRQIKKANKFKHQCGVYEVTVPDKLESYLIPLDKLEITPGPQDEE